MKKEDKAINLFPSKDYSFCKNLACKNYNKCVRATSNYSFERNEYISVFTFGDKDSPYFKEMNRCNNFIEKKYEDR